MVHSTKKREAKAGAGGKRPAGKGGKNSIKKRGKQAAVVKEVVWDDDARREYLTGFSKRKTEKKEAAKARAAVKEKEERLVLRQQLRDARKEQAANNVRMAKEYYGGDEAEGLQGGSGAKGDNEDIAPEEQEYSNEDMTSRVVIEEMRMSADEDEEEEEQEEDEDDFDMDGPNANMFAPIAPSRVKKSISSTDTYNDAADILREEPSINPFITPNDAPEEKPKPKRFTYESKAARRAESAKQKLRRMEKAESSKSRTGGKTGRGAKATGKQRGGKK